ncbi:MAG: sigma-54-dependent Fis family transcriptional regulator [Planctomycetes bacterium]|nr:sigma-54-dependent Fis family transcriptional regulator [Planctomycetota bacterium]
MTENLTRNSNKSNERDNIANVLIVDNDPQLAQFMLKIMAKKGVRGIIADDNKAAFDFLDKNDCDLIFSTSKIKNMSNSLELIQKVRADSPEMPMILIAEPANKKMKNQQEIADVTVKAIHAGYIDFLVKPLDTEKIENILDTLLPNHNIQSCDSAEQATQTLYRIVGKSPKLNQVVNLAKKVAPTSFSVLISGQSGTGKELISYLIHHNSKRAQGPYIKLNCAALSDTLLESELFGHERGAFTGAYSQRKGRFELAHGGTLLLDEITETSLKFQAKLLRAIEQQDFERVGGNSNVSVNVRIISTTNKNLLQEVAERRFREDLYYRLSGIRLIIPPLKDRKDDFEDLLWHFVNLHARQAQRKITRLDPDMMNIFKNFHWPGNIRQLRNVVITSLILGVGETLSLADVSWLFDELMPLPQETPFKISDTQVPASDLGGIALSQLEQQAILDTLRHTQGNQTKAAKVLGISDRTLRDKIKRYRKQQTLQPA